MFKSYTLIALRKLAREKTYVLIKIFSLALGIAGFLILGLYLRSEMMFDHHHRNHERIYRLNVWFHPYGSPAPDRFAITAFGLGPKLIADYPQLGRYVRLRSMPQNVLTYEANIRQWERLYLADPSVFEIFTHRILYGSVEQAFANPHSIAISESMAKHYFGDDNPIGRQIENGPHSLAVTLVFEDLPENTHLRYDALVPMSLLNVLTPDIGADFASNLSILNLFTYLQVPDEFDPQTFGAIAKKFADTYLAESAKKNMEHVELRWQRLEGIHFGEKLRGDLPVGNIFYVYGFGAVAVFILAIACINYVNLATARALRRAKEIGMRKVLGADRNQLIMQFMAEAAAFTAIALVIAFIVIQLTLALTPLGSLMGRETLLSDLADPTVLLGVLALGAIVAIVAGLYPALYLSSISPLAALTQSRGSWRTGFVLRHALVFAQLVISIDVIACTLLMMDQIRYVHEKPLGFEKENRVVLTLRGYEIASQIQAFRSELRNLPHVLDATHTLYYAPGTDHALLLLGTEVRDGVFEQRPMHAIYASINYVETMGIEIVRGRSFAEALETDKIDAVLVNEAFVKMMGWDEPLGKRFDVGGGKMLRVIGVTKDFHYTPLHNKIDALVMLPLGESLGPVPKAVRPFVTTTFIVAISGDNVPQTIKAIGSVVSKFDPKALFEPVFLDERLDALYKTESNLMKLTGVFAGVCVFIAGMGIFGLAAFTTEHRKKEIGIRKVLGASDAQIVQLLSRPLAWLVVFAALPASYAGYRAIDAWLERFAYRTDIAVRTFVLATAVVGLIALTTVVVQSLRTANADPVDALRQE